MAFSDEAIIENQQPLAPTPMHNGPLGYYYIAYFHFILFFFLEMMKYYSIKIYNICNCIIIYIIYIYINITDKNYLYTFALANDVWKLLDKVNYFFVKFKLI